MGITLIPPPPVVAARDLSFPYDGPTVVADVGFTLAPGEFVALVGPNGSGKSTLLRLLLGLLESRDRDRSSCSAMHHGPSTEPGRLGYVPQRGRLTPELPTTVREVVAGGRLSRRAWWRRPTTADRDAVEHALGAVALGDLADRLVTELSGGQQQRALIAKALVADPELLILDEPVAGVDAESQRLFRDSLVHLVREHHTTVLLVSHELGAVAADLDRVIVLKQRVLFDGTPADLAARGVSLGIHAEDLPLWLEELQVNLPLPWPFDREYMQLALVIGLIVGRVRAARRHVPRRQTPLAHGRRHRPPRVRRSGRRSAALDLAHLDRARRRRHRRARGRMAAIPGQDVGRPRPLAVLLRRDRRPAQSSPAAPPPTASP